MTEDVAATTVAESTEVANEVVVVSNYDDDTTARDDEGLSLHYDVVLCGTGLVQSILASALARCKKSVLHVDGADYYGGLEAVWTLPYLQSLVVNGSEEVKEANGELDDAAKAVEESILPLHPKGALASLRFHSMERKSVFPVTVGRLVQTPYGKGKVVAFKDARDCSGGLMQIELTGWKLADGTCPTVYTGIPHDKTFLRNGETVDSDYLWTHHRIRTGTAAAASAILDHQSRSLALDVTPYLLYASGPAVNGLLVSSVSDYVEFKSLEGLLYMENCKLSRVPCSKNDVFSSKLLSPMDKRRLMKFLQTAMDYATAEAILHDVEPGQEDAVDELQSWNERHLNQGRSLQRPQNKAVASTDLQQLQELCRPDADCTFEAYLREHQKLSPSLTALVRYALALDTGDDAASSSTESGMKQLCAHMLALGRFGGTAFLVPLYGSGELAQAFCRSAAVYGATYLLRRAPTGIVRDGNSKVQGILLNGPKDDEIAVGAKRIACTHVVVPDGAIAQQALTTGNKRVLRRISILRGKPVLADDSKQQQQQQRHVVILPPGAVSKKQTSAVHGLLLDEGVNVAPHVPGGCTVVHLTTTVSAGDGDDGTVDDSVLALALDAILRSCSTKESDVADVDEIFHVSFSYDLLSNEEASSPSDCDGMHVIRRPRPGLSADAAFDQAAEIFATICPGQEFLKMSKEMGDTVRASLGENALDEEDEETIVLESAVGMIEPPPPTIETARAIT